MIRELLLPLLMLFAVAHVAPAAAVEKSPVAAYRAEYQVLRNGGALGKATAAYQPVEGQTWELSTVTQGTEGLAALAGIELNEHSSLQWHQGRPETLGYRYRQSVAFKKPRERSVTVDPAAKQILSRDKEREYRFDFERGVLDRQSVTIALMQDLAAGRRGSFEYRVVDRDELETQRFRVAGEETIEVPAGAQRALKIERVRDSGGGRSTTYWFGLDQAFVPVKVVQREKNGETLEMRLVSVQR